MRPQFEWRLRNSALSLGSRTLIMGIVNVTPDSFSDGGAYFHTDLAVEHALKLLDEGADIIDIGGESTRPGEREPVNALEESRRVVPVIKAILRERPQAILSVDTHKAEVAARAINAGAEIINDVSGFHWDPEMPATAARLNCGCVLMHTRGRPGEWRELPRLSGDAMLELVKRELTASVTTAEAAGVRREALLLDPGFGFGKRHDVNYPLLARLGELQEIGLPLLAGVSRKSFIANTLDRFGAEGLLFGSLAAGVAAILNGAHILRVHEVRPAVEVAAIADAVLLGSGA